jgi:hypothetical protein
MTERSRNRRRCIGWTVDSRYILVRCPELFTPTTAADGRPKKYHSTKCLMWTFARRALGYVLGDVYIKGQFRGTKQILQCEFRGGLGLPEKWSNGVGLPEKWGGELPEQYRPPEPCLGQFEVRPQGRPAKYCKVCSPFAKKALSAMKANANYKADPVKGAKIARTNKHKRRKAAGLPIRPIGSMQPCQYPDKHGGKRAEGCEIKYKLSGSFQKYCGPCQLRADADRAQAYRDEHPEEVKARNVLLWELRRQNLVDLQAKAAELAQRPSDWYGKPIEWRVVGTELLSADEVSNKQLGERLDGSRIFKCPYGKDGTNWQTALSGPGSATNFISDVRKWMKRPGKSVRKA